MQEARNTSTASEAQPIDRAIRDSVFRAVLLTELPPEASASGLGALPRLKAASRQLPDRLALFGRSG